MYRYDSTYFDINKYEEENDKHLPIQVSQISVTWEKDRVIEVCYDKPTGKVIINDQNNWYYFTSPNISKMRLIDVIYGLGYRNEIIVVDWNKDNISPKDVLTSLVSEAPLNQITLHRPIIEDNSTMLLEVGLIIILMTITILCVLLC
jgi:hypothetical protein